MTMFWIMLTLIACAVLVYLVRQVDNAIGSFEQLRRVAREEREENSK
jgi:hypothetical protein